MTWLTRSRIDGGVLPVVLYVNALVAVVCNVLWALDAFNVRTQPRVRFAFAFALVCLVLGALVPLILHLRRTFRVPLPLRLIPVTVAGLGVFGLCLSVSFRGLYDLRHSGTVTGLLLGAWGTASALLATSLAVNLVLGIESRVGHLFGLAAERKLTAIPPKHLHSAHAPARGATALLSDSFAITSSRGFKPRHASIYFPPIALAPNAPGALELPVLVFMMGIPGNPDVTPVAKALDVLAAESEGWAPIAIVVDQLGSPLRDPGAIDSAKFGGVESYVNLDVPSWIRANLCAGGTLQPQSALVTSDSSRWIIGGYSNGGACALTWAAQHPQTWGLLISISGDEYTGAENPKKTVQEVYNGNQEAFEAHKPGPLLAAGAREGSYGGHRAVFTSGARDALFTAFAQTNAQLAAEAGWDVNRWVDPANGHFGNTIESGLIHAMRVLAPSLRAETPEVSS